ncbi:hypothetical protein UFOVP11_12 [uncultured Caudovirales phage]|uniref:Uncharacterized protein n=1 Tax=uncultured Caudovirales phage TaxID=2100421 RepID=A0A6J5KMG7_9CAUD|nr:hypothetical protein UFOVP11_12 [uncultured Caudovirales phage]
MAIFNKNTLTQVSGFDNPIIAGELVYQQATYWNLAFTSADLPVDLTGATISAQILRRQISNLQDTRYGLSFDIADYTVTTPSPVTLTVTNIVASAGTFTLVIDESAWSVIAADPQLDINATSPVGFSGRIKISFPASGTTPAQDSIIFLLFLVRSDGVVN